jgi:hypothetical protein
MSKYTLTDNGFKYTHGNYFQMPFIIIGVVMILLSIGSLFTGFAVLPIILILLGLFLTFSRKVVAVNFGIENYKETFSIFGISPNNWKPLPVIEYVSIFPTKVSQSIASFNPAMQTEIGFKEVRINLIHSRNKRLHVFTSETEEIFKQVALKFGEELKVGVYDCTGEENIWIKEDIR